jgi:hypothetical protein
MNTRLRIGTLGIALWSGACGGDPLDEVEIAASDQALCASPCTCSGATDTVADDPRNGCTTPIDVSPFSYYERIDVAGDRDWYSFTTTTRSGFFTYTFETDKPEDADKTTPVHCWLYLSNGSFIKSSTDDPTDPGNCKLLINTNLSGATYFIRVSHASSAGTGPYVARWYRPPT